MTVRVGTTGPTSPPVSRSRYRAALGLCLSQIKLSENLALEDMASILGCPPGVIRRALDGTDDLDGYVLHKARLIFGDSAFIALDRNGGYPLSPLARPVEAAAAPPVAPSPPQQPISASAGGRPAAKHGDVIAAVTLRLAALPAAELERYTVDALATELQADYGAIGEKPPNERNRETYASGILRVLRARQT